METINIISLMSQFLAAVITIFSYRKFKSKFVFYLCCLLILIVLIECIGAYQIVFKTNMRTIGFSNVYTFFEFTLITLMYRSLIVNPKNKKVIEILGIIFLVIYFSSFLIPKLNTFDLIPLESLLIAVTIVIYLAELLQSDKIINYKEHLPFWVSVGFFVFYLSSIPFFSMHKYMVERNLYYIIYWLIILMNLFVIFGLLWSKTEEKY